MARLRGLAGGEAGVGDVEALARENGRFLFVHLLVVPSPGGLGSDLAQRLRRSIAGAHWRVQYVAVEVVDESYLAAVRERLRPRGRSPSSLAQRR